MSSKPYKRRNYFIKQDLQGRYILGYFLLALGAVIFFVLIFAMLTSNTMTISYEENTLRLGRTPLILLKQFFAANWVFLLLGSGVLVVLAMMLTHRFAGPLYKFEKYIEEMSSGRLGAPLYLRTHDEGKELAGKIGAMSQQLAQSWRELDEIARQLEQEGGARLDCDGCRRSAELLRQLRRVLDRYTVNT